MTRWDLEELLAPLFADALAHHEAHYGNDAVTLTVTQADSGDAVVVVGTGRSSGLLLNAIVQHIGSHDDPVAELKSIMARRYKGPTLN